MGTDIIWRGEGMGFGIAFRRSVLEDVGFYDKTIIGGGDRVMMQSFYQAFDKELYWSMPFYNKKLYVGGYKDLPAWSRKIFERVQKSVFFTEGILFHLWHGDESKRKYLLRHNILARYGYDPETDIKQDENGCWVWATEKKDMHQAVAQYFRSRV